jgi:hypothetical protein
MDNSSRGLKSYWLLAPKKERKLFNSGKYTDKPVFSTPQI